MDNLESSKIYKVKYMINMLPMFGEYMQNNNGHKILKNKGVHIMEDCIESQ